MNKTKSQQLSTPTPNYYTILASKYKNPETLHQHLILAFKKLTTALRYNTSTTEYDASNTPMTLIFPFLRQEIINILLAVSSPISATKSSIITTLDYYHFQWWCTVFDRLNTLAAKDMILWFCFHIPYYDPTFFNHPDKMETLQANYCNLLDYASDKWLISNYFTEEEFLFVSSETCFPYAASYHWNNNKVLLTKYSQLLRRICGSWINYSAAILPQVHQKNKSTRIKICFISDSIVADSSVFRDRAALIGKLDKTRFEVYVASFIATEKITHQIAKQFISKLCRQEGKWWIPSSTNTYTGKERT